METKKGIVCNVWFWRVVKQNVDYKERMEFDRKTIDNDFSDTVSRDSG